jgi:cation transport ATPase
MKETFAISGMHCASCAARIETGVGEAPGVSAATVNFAAEELTVEYDPAVTGPAAIALGTSAAYFYSLFAFFGAFGPHGEVFFETSAMLIAFIRLGKYLEARARGKAGESLKKLLRLQADKARLLVEGEERDFLHLRRSNTTCWQSPSPCRGGGRNWSAC